MTAKNRRWLHVHATKFLAPAPSTGVARRIVKLVFGAFCLCMTTMMPFICLSSSASASTIPSSVNYWSKVQQFGAYGNVTLNDCSIAAIAALQQVWSASVGGSGQALATNAVVGAYESLVHGDDPGILPSQAFEAFQQGVAGRQIVSVAPYATDQGAVERAVWQLGGIYAVVSITGNDAQHANVPSALANTIAPWSLAEPTHPGAFAAEPHVVAVVGYNSQYVYLETWGSVQRATWSWWNARAVQTWAIMPTTFQALGHGPSTTIDLLNQNYFSVPQATSQALPYAT